MQRVTHARVTVGGEEISKIGPGLLVLLGVAHGDDDAVADKLADKILALRIFGDKHGRMNEPLGEREVLCVSQFTLLADTRRGNRPSFTGAAAPDEAKRLYERFCARTRARRGRFGAYMQVELENDGPVTIMLEIENAAAHDAAPSG